MKKIVLIMALSLSSTVFADPWSGKTKIKWLYPSQSGYHFGTTDYANKDLSTCDAGTRFHIPLDHPNYEAMVSSLIAAFAVEKDVNINIDGEGGELCSPSINRMFVYK